VLAGGAALYLAGVLLEYASRAGQSVATSYAVLRMIRALRMRLIAHVMELKAAFHDKTLSGTLVTRATGDFDSLSDSLNMGVLTSVVDLAVLAGCVVGMFVLSWQLALTTLVVLPFVAWIVQQFSRGLKTAMLKARAKISALNAYTQECLYGNATIKLLTGEREAARRYDVLNIEFRDAQMSSVVLDAAMFSVLDGIASITVGVVLWLAVTRSGIADAVSAGVMVAFVQYVQQLFEPLKQLGNKMAMLQGAFTSIDRVFGVLRHDERIAGALPCPPISGRVEFRDVSFAYDAAAPVPERILDRISFQLQPGESLAIVGPTGSGKSTIIKLLTKLYDGYQGTIELDGLDLAALEPTSLRRRVAIVPQDIVLFDGTVEFNISLGMDGVTRADVERAARQVGADEFIRRLPGGYDHAIRERGANLSHGQRQLIAFARALARNPGLVILDEATSSVDPESEAYVQAAIASLLKGRTVIVIAHRLSTIRRCDKILVLERGRVVEDGAHEELLARRAAYYRLHEAMA
jgi:ATP-binding cassette subfamily B protein